MGESRTVVVLETERRLFRDHKTCGLEACSAMEADPEVRRFSGKPRSRKAAEEKIH